MQPMSLDGGWETLLNIANSVWQFVHTNQSLVAGVLAIAAAFIAARPMWKQLSVLRQQVNIQSRDLIDLNIKKLERIVENIQDRERYISERVLYEQYGLVPMELSEPKNINPHLANDLEQNCRGFKEKIDQLLGNLLLPFSSEPDAKILATSLEKLCETFYDIHAPASVDFDDPLNGIADPTAAQSRAEKSEATAHKRVAGALSHVEEQCRVLCSSINTRVRELRRNLRAFEDQL